MSHTRCAVSAPPHALEASGGFDYVLHLAKATEACELTCQCMACMCLMTWCIFIAVCAPLAEPFGAQAYCHVHQNHHSKVSSDCGMRCLKLTDICKTCAKLWHTHSHECTSIRRSLQRGARTMHAIVGIPPTLTLQQGSSSSRNGSHRRTALPARQLIHCSFRRCN